MEGGIQGVCGLGDRVVRDSGGAIHFSQRYEVKSCVPQLNLRESTRERHGQRITGVSLDCTDVNFAHVVSKTRASFVQCPDVGVASNRMGRSLTR
jgi:hypothetical protein